MPNLIITWKGCPRRHLPRIRVASTGRKPTRSRSTARTASGNGVGQPSGVPNRERKRPRFIISRRRIRSSGNSSALIRARKQVSLRARQHLQVFGWSADISSKANTVKAESVKLSFKAIAGHAHPVTRRRTPTQTTVVESYDGASGSALRSAQPAVQRQNLYSARNVSAVPVYWSSRKPAKRKKSSIASNQAGTRPVRRSGKDIQLRPFEPASKRTTYYGPQEVERCRAYDNRIDPRTRFETEHKPRSSPPHPQLNPPKDLRSTTTKRRASSNKNTENWRSADLCQTVYSTGLKTKADPQSDTQSMKSIALTIMSDLASRTPSQKKSLKQFTKELELYLQATKALPKQKLVPSLSATTVSAYTIEALKLYQTQFQSAGLAVTSAEQTRKSPVMAKFKKPASPPPTPPKDEKYAMRTSTVGNSETVAELRKNVPNENHHHHKTDSLQSFDSLTTLMAFTPPHEQNGPQGFPDRTRRTLSSEHTVTSFTPAYEKTAPAPRYTPPPSSLPPRSYTKKPLPWLRRQVSPAERPSPPAATTRDKPIVSTMKEKARNPSDVLLSFSIGRDSIFERTVISKPRGEVSGEIQHRNPDYKWQDQSYSIGDKRNRSAKAATQLAPGLSDNFELTDQGVRYVDSMTQTDLLDLVAIKAGNGATAEEKEDKPQTVQTNVVEKSIEARQHNTSECKSALPKSIPASPGWDRAVPFSSPSPFRTSSTKPSPHKSVDELEDRRSRARKDVLSMKSPSPVKHYLPSPTSHAPSPLNCVQRNSEILSSTIEPMPETRERETDLWTEFWPESPTKSCLNHICTARSSLQCQQCAPPRDHSEPVSPRHLSLSLRTHSPKREPRQSPNCKTPPESITIPYQEMAPPALQIDIDEAFNAYHMPEENRVQNQFIVHTMTGYTERPPVQDPVKNPPPPRFRPRPVPTTNISSKLAGPERSAQLVPVPGILDTASNPSEPTTPSRCLDRPRTDTVISDRGVFRGLHVATAAACDEDTDKWIEEITGCGVRRFLTDLSTFDGLGFNTLATAAKRAARQRRGALIAWERAQEKRLNERHLPDVEKAREAYVSEVEDRQRRYKDK